MIARHSEGSSPNYASRGRESGVHVITIKPPAPLHQNPSSHVVLRSPQALTRARGAFVLDVLERIEATPDTQALLFSRGDHCPTGEVVSYGGQVCMVTLAKGEVPLAARLRKADPALAEAIRDALARAKVDGRSLGDALSALGPRPAEIVRGALHDQFLEGLLALSRFEPKVLFETAHSSPRRLPSMLTSFSALDLYWSAVAHFAPKVTDAAKTCFDELAEQAESAALIAWGPESGGAPILLAARGFMPSSVAEIAKLSCFVERTLRTRAFIASGEEPTVVSLGHGNDLVVGLVSPTHMAMFVGVRPDIRARLVSRMSQMAPSTR